MNNKVINKNIMYCKKCGNEIPLDSKFCPNSGAKQSESVSFESLKDESVKEDSSNDNSESADLVQKDIVKDRCDTNEVKELDNGEESKNEKVQADLAYNNTEDTVKKLPLLSRFLGSLIDKVILFFCYLICFGITVNLYNSIVLPFLLANLIYYILFESMLSASFGKFLVGGVLCDIFDDKVGYEKALARGVYLSVFIIVLNFILHSLCGLKYITVLVVFFLLLDIPVLFTKRSLLDICTGTTYLKNY